MLNGPLPPSPPDLWNQRVRGKFGFNLRAAMRCGQNLENKADVEFQSFKGSEFQGFKEPLSLQTLYLS
jgi:hypothetical protein